MKNSEWFQLSSYTEKISPKEIVKIVNFKAIRIVLFCSSFFADLKFKAVKRIRIDLTDDLSIQETVEKPVYAFPVCRVIMHYDPKVAS